MPFNGSMMIWVSTIILWPIPTCIPTKCEIYLRLKVWYNMRLKNKFLITKVNNSTSYQIWRGGFGFLAFLHFLVKVLAYKCSTPLGSLHGFIHHLKISRFVHVGCMHTKPQLYVSLHVKHIFFHTKSMLLKGDFFGFWISIYWDFEAWPMFEIMPWADCTRKNNKLILMSKTLYLQYVELHVNCHIQY